MKNIELMALDKDFNILSYISYTNLQWRRKYYESGSFSVQFSSNQYSADICYIYTKDRPEVGRVEQINYIDSNGSKVFALSGHFLENDLNRRIVYSLGDTNITSAPTWESKTGKAESVAYDYFNAFKDVTYSYNGESVTSLLGISSSTSLGRGNDSSHARRKEYLGDKIHTILKPSEMSYRIKYNITSNNLKFEVWKGVDRTSSNDELNNPIILSTAYGNVINPDIVISKENYKNAYIAENTYHDSTTDKDVVSVYARAERSEVESAYDDIYVLTDSSANYDDYASKTEYINALHSDGHVAILDNVKKISVDFDTTAGSYEYLTDFDLGDKCSIEIPEMGLSCDAVLKEINEVLKKGVHEISLSFDTPETYKGGL